LEPGWIWHARGWETRDIGWSCGAVVAVAETGVGSGYSTCAYSDSVGGYVEANDDVVGVTRSHVDAQMRKVILGRH